MNLALTVAEIVSPVFLLGAVGFVWVRLGYEYRIGFITQLSMTLAIPCLIFTALMETEIAPSALADISVAAFVVYAAISVFLWSLLSIFRLDRRTFLAPLIFGNTGNLGLPLALFAFGNEGLGFAVVVFAVMAIYSFTVGVWMVSGGGSPTKLVREPMVVATLLGGLFLWQGWSTPTFLTNTLSLIGQLAIPLMLITLGVAVARLTPANLGQSFWLSLLKAAVCIGIAVPVGLWFELETVPFAILVLQVGTPVAVSSYLIAEKYGADSDAVAGLVVVSTLLSVALLPLLLGFMV